VPPSHGELLPQASQSKQNTYLQNKTLLKSLFASSLQSASEKSLHLYMRFDLCPVNRGHRSSVKTICRQTYDFAMADSPAFFLPDAAPDQQESDYIQIAHTWGFPLPPLKERVYSVTFNQDGDQWTATVGERLHGRRNIREGRKKTDRTLPIEDPALVRAIFPPDASDPSGLYRVVTDGGSAQRRRSHFANPFAAGRPAVVYFSEPKSSV
jgi:hypothetical protein